MKLKIEPIQIGVAGEYLAATEISWALTKKAEEYFSENHVYIFVAIKGIGGERNEYRIVQSERVARQMKEGDQNWLQEKKIIDYGERIHILGTSMKSWISSTSSFGTLL